MVSTTDFTPVRFTPPWRSARLLFLSITKSNMNHQTILVLDYGSQDAHLICRRVRQAQVYAELVSWGRAEEALHRVHPNGIILSGGPNSVYEPNAPTLPPSVLDSGVPVLGICYGLQLLAHRLGGQVAPG